MLKILLSVILLSVSALASAQKVLGLTQTSKYIAYVKGDMFEGTIISKDFVLPFVSDITKESRFTPTVKDVEDAELLLNRDLKSLNNKLTNQGMIKGPVIHDNLAKYARQYFGYIDSLGQRIVFISNLWSENYKTEKDKNWKIGAVVVMDGGSNYWQVKANLTANLLFDFNVNGLD